jgi:two-component system OmpR family sensor kinase
MDLGVNADAPAWVQGHAEALRILLRNLLDNALKYTPAQGRVDVGLVTTPGSTTLTVEDSGPGIAPADLPHVFDRFYRSTDAGASGSGLGLAIAQAIAHSHKAQLALDASPTLGGLRVTLTFPSPSPRPG